MVMRSPALGAAVMVIVTLSGFAGASQASAQPPSPPPLPGRAAIIDGRVLVAFDGSVSPDQRSRVQAAVNGHERRRIGAGVTVLDVPLGQVASAVTVLRSLPGIRYAEPDYSQETAAVPNDPSFPQQWAHQNTGQIVGSTAGTAGADERTTGAWSVTTGSRSVVVAELDTGVDYNHPDLAANIWSNPGGLGGCAAGTHGFNVLTGGCDPMDDDTQYGGHGTHVAGIIGAAGNNGTGVAGVNWTTTILPVKWVNSSGSGATSDLISAMDTVLQAKQAGVNVRVVNDSDVFVGTAYSQALSDEIDLLDQQGILFVTAAGNSGADNDAPASRRYPCAYGRDNEICVTASDQNDSRPSWANYGASTVDLAAPGDNIYSTLRGGGYGYLSGGSMAAPQVTGAAALTLSHQSLTTSQLKAALIENVDKVPSFSGVVRTGGRLNVCAAVGACAARAPATLGTTSIGPNGDSLSANRKRVNRYSLAVPASVSSLSFYLQPTGTAGSQVLQGVLYADTGGAPSSLIATTSTFTYSGSKPAGWYAMPFATAVSVPAGPVWMGVISGGSSNVAGFRWTSLARSRVVSPDSFADGPSNPFGASSTDSELMSLYATYTTSATSSVAMPFPVTAPRTVADSGPHPSPEPQVGRPVSGTNGTWDGGPTAFAYSWSRCSSAGTACVQLTGATAATYIPVSADTGSTLRLRVSATSTAGTVSSISAPTLPVQAAPGPGAIGTTTVGATTDPATADWERVDVLAVPTAGTLTSVQVYLQRLASGSQQFRGLLYADAGGTPGALVAATSAQTVGAQATSGWQTLPFTAPVPVSAGTYWLGILAGPTSEVFALRYDDSTTASGAVTYQPWTSGPRNPFAAVRLEPEKFSVYATWSP
jgi:subtilisin family serine protease